MNIIIETTSRLPIYQQIVSQVREGIARGMLSPGERLPSVRELSRSLVVNPNTIARAYMELEREGTLLTRPGMGVFVAAPRQELLDEIRSTRLHESIVRLLTEAALLGFSREETLAMIQDCSHSFQWLKQEDDPSNDNNGRAV